MRSPSSPFVETTVRPSFLPTVPERNPRKECGCHPVAFSSSLAVAPPDRFSISRIVAVLLPFRAPVPFFAALGAFFAGVAFPAFPLLGATLPARLLTLAFLAPLAPLLWPGRWRLLQ